MIQHAHRIVSHVRRDTDLFSYSQYICMLVGSNIYTTAAFGLYHEAFIALSGRVVMEGRMEGRKAESVYMYGR